MSDEVQKVSESRSSLVHVRVKPALRDLIDSEARSKGTTPSAVIRRVLAQHYEAQPKGRP